MHTRDFDYDLPEELIAQEPATRRDGSRLLVLDRARATRRDHRFAELPELLPPGSLLVLNDSRVFPARLRARKQTGGAVEVLLVSPVEDDRAAAVTRPTWRCLCRSSKGLRAGQRLHFDAAAAHPPVSAEVCRALPDGAAELRFRQEAQTDEGTPDWFLRWVQAAGETPLPPYIQRPDGERAQDRERYQTVYARHGGSVAAPTAGLHFTEALLARLAAAGVEQAFVTLHVGPGTFRPVRAERVTDHRMDAERAHIPAEAADRITRAKRERRPVVAVGTTTVRALEGAAEAPGRVRPGRHDIDLFITPGYELRVVDGLITNFHLPRSTLLMLVSALAGREAVLDAYRHAVAERYRFYSYGDAMWIR
ncbi:MAG: tRNA preQ1(34) S-adenosylmethionine ribosyltransferase-isomerase QueA [bacterium]